MRRIIVLILVALSSNIISQDSNNTLVDFEVNDLKLSDCLDALSNQTGIAIGYSSQLFDNKELISLNIKQSTIQHILKNILSDKNILFKKIGGQYILYTQSKTYSINGKIKDKLSGEKLLLASIYCHNNQNGSYANEEGYFSLHGENENFKLEIKYIGYETLLLEVNASNNQDLNIELTANTRLSDIIIIPDNFDSFSSNDPYQGKPITDDIVEVSPSLAGESDYIRSTQALAGVSSANDGFAGLQVRGSDSGQNLMLIDGVPIYLPYHLLGAYSIYNPNLVRSAKLINSYFPARYGGRTSSVFDIWMKDGHNENYHSQFDINLTNIKLHLEGPIKKGKGSFIIGGRFSPRNFLFEPIYKKTFFQTTAETITSNFNDINLKANYKLNSKNTLILSLLNANDRFNSLESEEEEEEENEIEFTWKNIIGSLHLNSILSKKLFLRTSFSLSSYGYKYNSLNLFGSGINDFYYLNTQSNNEDVGLSTELQVLPTGKHAFRFGIGITKQKFQPGLTVLHDEDEQVITLSIEELDKLTKVIDFSSKNLYFYAEDYFQVNSKLKIDLGFRYHYFIGDKKTYSLYEPRILINYLLSKDINLYGSISNVSQPLHLISNITLRLPTDLWLPSSEHLEPQQANIFNIGLNYKLSKHSNIKLEAYSKSIKNIYTYKADISLDSNLNDLEPFEYLTNGKGFVKGLELSFDLKKENFGFMSSYTLSDSKRQFDNINDNIRYPFEFDHKHQFKIFAYRKLNKNFLINFSYNYASGKPLLGILKSTDTNGLTSYDLNENGLKNNLRTSAYHRVDMNISYTKKTSLFLHKVSLGAYNVTNRNNVSFHNVIENSNGTLNQTEVFSLPFIPSFSYSISY